MAGLNNDILTKIKYLDKRLTEIQLFFDTKEFKLLSADDKYVLAKEKSIIIDRKKSLRKELEN